MVLSSAFIHNHFQAIFLVLISSASRLMNRALKPGSGSSLAAIGTPPGSGEDCDRSHRGPKRVWGTPGPLCHNPRIVDNEPKLLAAPGRNNLPLEEVYASQDGPKNRKGQSLSYKFPIHLSLLMVRWRKSIPSSMTRQLRFCNTTWRAFLDGRREEEINAED